MYVSVLVPSYNRAALLPRALDSVAAQTRPADEVIVIDDGSDDDTAHLLQTRYAHVRHVRLTTRRGVSAARNAGLAAARGEWLALLDSDDAWHPDKLRTQTALAADRAGRRLVHCNETWLCAGHERAQRRYHQKRGGDIFFDCLPRCVISPSTALLHRGLFERFGTFDETLPACEDYDLWLRICAHEAVTFAERALVDKHGGHVDQLSRTVPALDRYRIRALSGLLERGTLSAAQVAATRTMLARKLDIFLSGARKRAHREDVLEHLALRERFCA